MSIDFLMDCLVGVTIIAYISLVLTLLGSLIYLVVHLI